jgi:CubicO group peptidase (beta-lactamase class C family)
MGTNTAINLASGRAYDFSRASELLERGVSDGVFPGAVLVIGQGGQILFQHCVGKRTAMPTLSSTEPGEVEAGTLESKEVEIGTVFDIAGLTAAVSTATLLMRLYEAGKFKLEDRISRYLQGFGVFGKSAITVAQLLNHTSGLPAWYPFFEDLLREHAGARMGILTSRGARDYIINAVNRSTLRGRAGERQLYSDIGLILLGHLVELLTGISLDKAFYRLVAQPLGLKSTSFIDLSMIKRRGIHPVTEVIAPTEQCPWRARILCGEVHDDNAWAMGGIAGHSGLFSAAMDLHIFATEMLASYLGQSMFLSSDTLKRFWKKDETVPGVSWCYGWDAPSKENGMADVGFSASSVGLNGFTGCSLWLDLQRSLDIVLMSNRIHPTRNNKKILTFRPELHTAIMQALGSR